MEKRIGILTTFGSWDEAYSLCNVVKTHLLALTNHGYKPVLFVLDCFPKEFTIAGVDIKRVIPTITFEPYQGIAVHHNVPNQMEKDVAKIVPIFDQYFKDIDVLLCHDVIFQDSFLAYNAALRKMVMPKGLKLYHWMHSGPSLRPAKMQAPVEYLYTLPPQSKAVYMNRYDTVRVAEMYGVYPKDVFVVHNPIDYRLQGVHPLTKRIITEYKLNEADVIGVYPLSTTRMGTGGKQLHKAIKIMAGLKKLGMSVRYVIPNAHANGANEKAKIMEMIKYSADLGLTPEEIIFTSLIDAEWERGVPHQVVVELFRLSDVFLFPSVSENAPLILLEAALAGNLMVLNEDFTPMKDFVGPSALYFKFDSVTTTTNHPRGEDVYYDDVAKIIQSELLHNRIYLSRLMTRKLFNVDYIFKNEIEPLFFYEEVDMKPEVKVAEGQVEGLNIAPEPPPFSDNPGSTKEKNDEYPWW